VIPPKEPYLLPPPLYPSRTPVESSPSVIEKMGAEEARRLQEAKYYSGFSQRALSGPPQHYAEIFTKRKLDYLEEKVDLSQFPSEISEGMRQIKDVKVARRAKQTTKSKKHPRTREEAALPDAGTGPEDLEISVVSTKEIDISKESKSVAAEEEGSEEEFDKKKKKSKKDDDDEGEDDDDDEEEEANVDENEMEDQSEWGLNDDDEDESNEPAEEREDEGGYL